MIRKKSLLLWFRFCCVLFLGTSEPCPTYLVICGNRDFFISFSCSQYRSPEWRFLKMLASRLHLD